MALTVQITGDDISMSRQAEGVVLEKLQLLEATRVFNLGLSTGSTPKLLYKLLAKDQGEGFDPTRIRTRTLDEYVRHRGEVHTPENPCKESYEFFMQKNFFSYLDHKFIESHIPPGMEIDEGMLEDALDRAGSHVMLDGKYSGKAVRILPACEDPYLRNIWDNILGNYWKGIVGEGIDLQICGVGEKGHVAFHEKGIPLHYRFMLVKLDENTIQNAIDAGNLKKPRKYAVTMGAAGIREVSQSVMALASGQKKTQAVADSLLGPVSADCPLSILQEYIPDKSRSALYIVDEVAAAGLIGKEKRLEEKGIKVIRD